MYQSLSRMFICVVCDLKYAYLLLSVVTVCDLKYAYLLFSVVTVFQLFPEGTGHMQ